MVISSILIRTRTLVAVAVARVSKKADRSSHRANHRDITLSGITSCRQIGATQPGGPFGRYCNELSVCQPTALESFLKQSSREGANIGTRLFVRNAMISLLHYSRTFISVYEV